MSTHAGAEPSVTPTTHSVPPAPRHSITETDAWTLNRVSSSATTLTGIVSNLKDEWALWLNQFAEQGALDSFKTELLNLKATLAQLAAEHVHRRLA